MKEVTIEDLGLDYDFFKMTDREIFDGLKELRYIDKDAVYVEDSSEQTEVNEDRKKG